MSRGTTRQGVTPCKQIGVYQNHGQGERYSASYASLYQKVGNGCKVGRPGNRRQIVRHRYGLNSGKRSLRSRRSKPHANGAWKNQSSTQLKPPEVLNACPRMTQCTPASSTQPEHDLHEENLQPCYAFRTFVIRRGVTLAETHQECNAKRRGVTPALARGGCSDSQTLDRIKPERPQKGTQVWSKWQWFTCPSRSTRP